MELPKDEIAEELTSLQEIMRALRRRRRGLQQKQAIQGINAPVEVFTLNYLPHQLTNVPQPPAPFDFARLRKAILLDRPTAVRLFHEREAPVQPVDINTVEHALLDPHDACRQDDIDQYSRFFGEVRAARTQASAAH
jgi:hypothetical protein